MQRRINVLQRRPAWKADACSHYEWLDSAKSGRSQNLLLFVLFQLQRWQFADCEIGQHRDRRGILPAEVPVAGNRQLDEKLSGVLDFVTPTRPQAALMALVLATIVVMMVWERRYPAYPVDHHTTWKRDLMATIAYIAVIAPLAQFIGRYVSFRPVLPQQVFALPLALRFFMFVVIADFGFYWVHRAMHTKWLWNLHRWHHSPTYMYWLMGVRGSLLQQVLVNIPYFFAQTLLAVSPWWTVLAIYFKTALQNNWMHLNVRWGSRLVEWFIITPRYHHIHHSDNPAYYGANIAAIFPIWDHLFGTYVDPDTVPASMHFGTDEKAPAWRLAVGI